MQFKQLETFNSPRFVLFKNLKFKEDSLLLDIHEIKQGEIVYVGDTYTEVSKYIPKSIYPTDVEKQQLFEDKYGDRDDVDFSFNVSPYAIVDIDPEDVERMPDFDIFGESYTVLWVCPADVEVIVKSLINHIKRQAKQNSTIGGELYTIWVDYIDNISINSHQDQIAAVELITQVKKVFEKEVNLLPNIPTQNDWDFIEEMAGK